MAKKPSNRLIRKAIRELIEPEIAARGFTGKYPEFQRESGDEFHFIDIGTAKYGGGFGITGAWGTRECFGQYPPCLAATDFDDRACITRAVKLWRVDGTAYTYRPKIFDYELLVKDAESCRELVCEALAAMPALDAWFDTKRLTAEIDNIYSEIDSVPNPDLGRLIAAAKAELDLY